MWKLKKLRQTDREMTTPLFLLRCVQLGLSMADMELLSIGLINDMYGRAEMMIVSMHRLRHKRILIDFYFEKHPQNNKKCG
jgi:hypothetical protein